MCAKSLLSQHYFVLIVSNTKKTVLGFFCLCPNCEVCYTLNKNCKRDNELVHVPFKFPFEKMSASSLTAFTCCGLDSRSFSIWMPSNFFKFFDSSDSLHRMQAQNEFQSSRSTHGMQLKSGESHGWSCTSSDVKVPCEFGFMYLVSNCKNCILQSHDMIILFCACFIKMSKDLMT